MSNNELTLKKNWESLATAIVGQAIVDHTTAIEELDKGKELEFRNKWAKSFYVNTRKRLVRETEEFFESDWCKTLTGIPSETLKAARLRETDISRIATPETELLFETETA